MATLKTLTATIAAGQSLSNVVDVGSGSSVVGLILPAAWDHARVTVVISVDGVNFHDLFSFYDPTSTSLTEFKFNVTPGAIVAIDPDTTLMARYFKLRSGTRDESVPQKEARVFTVITINRAAMQLLPELSTDEIDSNEAASV